MIFLTIAAGTLFLLLFLFLLFSIWTHSVRLHSGHADVLIVLGYKCDDEDIIPPPLLERLEMAKRLHDTINFKKIILTGGKVGNSTLSEAEMMKAYLIGQGIQTDKMELDVEAKDTIENLINCREIMQFHGFQSCVVVSNSFHIRRVRYIGKSVGLKITCTSDRRWFTLFTQFARTLNEIKAYGNTLRLLRKYKQSNLVKGEVSRGARS